MSGGVLHDRRLQVLQVFVRKPFRFPEIPEAGQLNERPLHTRIIRRGTTIPRKDCNLDRSRLTVLGHAPTNFQFHQNLLCGLILAALVIPRPLRKTKALRQHEIYNTAIQMPGSVIGLTNEVLHEIR